MKILCGDKELEACGKLNIAYEGVEKVAHGMGF